MASKADAATPAAKAPRKRDRLEAGAEPRRSAASPTRRPARGTQWPVWTAVVLTGLYLLLHLDMIPVALTLWGGLLSALVLGQ